MSGQRLGSTGAPLRVCRAIGFAMNEEGDALVLTPTAKAWEQLVAAGVLCLDGWRADCVSEGTRGGSTALWQLVRTCCSSPGDGARLDGVDATGGVLLGCGW